MYAKSCVRAQEGSSMAVFKNLSWRSSPKPRACGRVCAGLHVPLGLPVGCWVSLGTFLSALSPVAWQVWEPLNEARNLVVVMGSREMGPGVSQNSHYSRTCPLPTVSPFVAKEATLGGCKIHSNDCK